MEYILTKTEKQYLDVISNSEKEINKLFEKMIIKK
tara:strand:- start:73 stop:177 length:105 start_codon:yes stop_codon:yes gene_type:complete